MKRINIILGIGLLFSFGCGDFLDTEPKAVLNEESFYRTQDDAYTALTGCYDGLQIIYNQGQALPILSEVFSDNTFGATGNVDGFGWQMVDEFDKQKSPSDLNMFEGNWIAYYKALYRINVFLQKFDQIAWDSEEIMNQYEAEVRFMRAYMYFDMVRLWERVPLLLEPSDENVPQAEPEAVYAAIAEDLEFAIANLRAQTYAAQSPTSGRVTKWAAEALTARVFLFYTGYYEAADLVGVVTQAEALAYLEDAIANSGHALVDDFATLWPAASLDDYAGEDNIETVFGIKYTYTSDYDGNTDGNHWMVMYGIREQSIYPYGNGWGGATVTPKLWNDFDDEDTRKVASIISFADEELDFEKIEGQREYTGYTVKKYSPVSNEGGTNLGDSLGTNFMIGNFQDYVAIRYADVLLMAAELGSPNAQTYFDQVRQRAYGAAFSALPVNQANLMQERYFEFAFEGIRYWDLLRQGLDVAAQAVETNTPVLNGGVSAQKVINGANLITTRGFQQIPYNQITRSNGVLVQNAGW